MHTQTHPVGNVSNRRSTHPVLHAPSSVLTLPRISPQVPQSYSASHDDIAPLIAEVMADLNILTPDSWCGNIATSCTRALSKWASDVKGYHANVGLEIMPLVSDVMEVDSAATAGFAITTNTYQPVVHIAKDKLERIERLCPGGGQAILHTIDNADINIFTPAYAFSACCWFHWNDQTDESAWAKSMDEEHGEKVDLAEVEHVKLADWQAAMPEWAYKPKPAAISNPRKKERFPKVFDLLHKVTSFNRVNEWRGINYNTGICTPLVLDWTGAGMTCRMYDDLANHYMQGGDEDNTTRFGFIPCSYDKASIRVALLKLRKLLDHMNDLIQLIQLISQPLPNQ